MIIKEKRTKIIIGIVVLQNKIDNNDFSLIKAQIALLNPKKVNNIIDIGNINIKNIIKLSINYMNLCYLLYTQILISLISTLSPFE